MLKKTTFPFKGIVQPLKRGVMGGINRPEGLGHTHKIIKRKNGK